MSAGVDEWFLIAFVFIMGLCVGSFLNVVIYRLPMGKSIISPGSMCSECGSPLRAFDNIPLLSWLILMGNCRDCGTSISFRYFFVELFTGIITLLVVNRYGFGLEALLYSIFAWGLIAVAFIDLDFQIIPDELSVGGVIVGLLISPLLVIGLKGAAIGALLGGGIFFILAILYPGGMGGGDIKLMAAIGVFLGWQLTGLTILIGSALGSIVGLGSIAFLGKSRKDRIPFGPFLALGGLVALLWGEDLIAIYVSAII